MLLSRLGDVEITCDDSPMLMVVSAPESDFLVVGLVVRSFAIWGLGTRII